MKTQYPIFYESSERSLVAVFGPKDAFEILPHGFGKSAGFSFNRYKSRAKVIKLENSAYNRIDVGEFYDRCFNYFRRELGYVAASTKRSLPGATFEIKGLLKK